MRVSRKPKNTFCDVGDIVLYKEKACMVAQETQVSDDRIINIFLLIGLEDASAGRVVQMFTTLFDVDAQIDDVLISKGDVVICREGEN